MVFYIPRPCPYGINRVLSKTPYPMQTPVSLSGGSPTSRLPLSYSNASTCPRRIPSSRSQPQLHLPRLDLVAPRPRLIPVVRLALRPLHPEAGVDFALRLVAHARRLVEEAARVALLEGVDDLYAGFAGLLAEGGPIGRGGRARLTEVLGFVKV